MNKQPTPAKTPMTGKQRARVLWRITRYLFRYPGLVILALFLMISANLLALAGPKLSGLAIDEIVGPGEVNFERVFLFCGLMIAFYAASGILSYILSVVMVNLSQRITYTMRKEVFDHLTDLPVGFFDSHQTGEIVSRLSYDIDTVNASLSNDVLQVCANSITIVGSFVMMLTISPVLICVFVITVPISLIFTKYKSTHIRPLFRKRSAKLGELNGFAEEMLSGQKTIRTYGKEQVITDRFDLRNQEACEAYYKADYHGSVIGPTVNFVSNLSIALITLLGSIFYMFSLGGTAIHPLFVIKLGDVGSFVQYARKFAGPINEFANIFSELQSALSAAERVFGVIDQAPEPADKPDAVELDARGQVTLHRVEFGYVPEKQILHGLSVKVEPGQTVAIVGPTGAGKTTIINLLMRFYDIDAGQITFDGIPITDATRDSLRKSFTMVLQDTWLFGGTIRDNIAYGREDATDEEVVEAAKSAKIHHFIMSLPNGYQTKLADGGVNLSKGQRQLITIARAMLSRAPMLILDEATSNVDSRTEHRIQDAMMALMKGKTCFVIAHRLSTVQHADNILVVKDGNIIESGTHEQLLASGGFYASLYGAQFVN